MCARNGAPDHHRRFPLLFRTPVLFTLLVSAVLYPSFSFGDYPRIKSLNRSDPLYVQLESGISDFYQADAREEPVPPLQLFRYITTEEQNLFVLASRCGITFESLATLNRLSANNLLPSGSAILIPSIPGLFIPDTPESELETMLVSGKGTRETAPVPVTVLDTRRHVSFSFFPGERFNTMELSIFLGIFFRYPLDGVTGTISSHYGQRISPITGSLHFHHGIDIAAPAGTGVVAVRDGTVTADGYDDIYGNYILLAHAGGYHSFYGHLHSSLVELNQKVKSGSIIATVGSTGQSTGPHLHFELLKDSSAVDPLPLLPRKGQ